jgi:cbb3-type cytochrome oxidase subunit 1
MNLSINDYGQLNYSFIDIVVVTIPYHWMRLAGGLMFLSGTLPNINSAELLSMVLCSFNISILLNFVTRMNFWDFY